MEIIYKTPSIFCIIIYYHVNDRQMTLTKYKGGAINARNHTRQLAKALVQESCIALHYALLFRHHGDGVIFVH